MSDNRPSAGARRLLALYPARSRVRYGEELLALLAESGIGPGTVLDVLRSALHEPWVAALDGPSGASTERLRERISA